MSLKAKAISGARWNFVSTLLSSTAQLVQLLVLARYLAPHDYGVMGLSLIVIGFSQAFQDMGFSAAIIQRQNVTSLQLSSIYWLNLGVGAGLSVIVALSAVFFAGFFHESELTPILRLVGVTFFISSFGLQFNWLLEKELEFKTLAKIESSLSLIGATIAILLAIAGWGVWALAWSQLVTATIKTGILLHQARRRRWLPSIEFQWSSLAGIVSFGAFQIAERTINYFNSRADQILIGRFLGTTELGYYNFAFNAAYQIVNRINPVVTRIAFPVLSRVQDDAGKTKRAYFRIVNAIGVTNAPLLIGLASVSAILVPVVFSAKWTPAIPVLAVTCFTAYFRSAMNPLGSLLLSRGRADLGFYWNLVPLSTMLPVMWLASRFGDLVMVSLSLLALQLIYLALVYPGLLRPLVGRCLRDYITSFGRPLVPALLMGVAVWIAGRYLPVTRFALAILVAEGILIHTSLAYFVFKKSTHDFLDLAFPGKMSDNSTLMQQAQV